MAAVGFAFLVVLFAVVAPLALYWFVREEDPDPGQTTSWGEARANATEDRFGDGTRSDRGDRRDGAWSGRDDRRDESPRGAREDGRGEKSDRRAREDWGRDRDGRDDGNHWG